ncbi:MAG: DUF6797 domain-containing protein [Planctomycetota bacterium]
MPVRYWTQKLIALAFCALFSANLGHAQSLQEQLASTDLRDLLAATMKQGDAKRGAILFHQPLMQCAKCHSVTGEASPLGPNLAKFDQQPTPEHLLESILMPSKVIKEGYQTVKVLTEEDQVITGILADENDKVIRLRDPSQPGTMQTLVKDELVSIAKPKQSVMPEGLLSQLAGEEQFYDLAKYVLEVAERGVEHAASLQPPASMTKLPPLPEYEAHIAHSDMLQDLDRESFKRGQKIYNRVCANCHGTHDQEGSLPTSPRFAKVAKLKNGHEPFRMYQTLTHGHGLMVAQRWMVPQQKYDVIHYIREDYFKRDNKALYSEVSEDYLAGLPEGDTRGPEPVSFEKYVAMDYGPSLINTYEIQLNNEGNRVGRDLGRGPRSDDPWANPDEYFEPGEAPNYAYKGIAVRLDPGPGGVSRGKYWMVYDHDTMSMNAAWGGTAFIDYCCIQFDGQHNTHNRLMGKVFVENPVGPGWGQPLTGVFHDPRPVGRDGRPYGPLPSAWYKYEGLYHHDLKTILAYRVGNARILEYPEVVESGSPVFVRNLSIGPASHRLRLRLGPASGDGAVQAKVIGQANYKIEEDNGFRVLVLDRHDSNLHLKVLVSNQAIPEDVELADPVDLAQYTHGSAPRWPERVKTRINTVYDDVFAVDELALPTSNPWNAQVRATGLDFYADNQTMALCTWDGDVWRIEGASADQGELVWQRIATGLFQPLGLKIVKGEIFVTCRDQLVRLHDLNGDYETDYYECFNSDHQVTEHFHEFAMGLQADELGNFYYAKSGRHAKRAVVPHHGTLLKIAADGSRTDILATGFRAANGVCMNPDGSFFVTDQEGHWNPKNRINWVTEGGFYGNMYSFTDVVDASDDAMSQPLCWITNAFDRSPAELLWVPENAWGPLGGSLLNLSYGYGKIFVVPHESVKDQLQGGMCQLPIPDFPSGLVRGRFHPSRGDLYACGMFSWAGSRQAPGCFHRVRYAGQPSHLPLELNAEEGIFKIRFSDPIDVASIESNSFKVKAWDLKRTPNYGSKHYNERQLAVDSASLGADGKTVILSIRDLAPTWCMSVEYNLKGANGRVFRGVLHNSIHNLGD